MSERSEREAAEAREQLSPALARAEIDRRRRKKLAKAAGEEFTEQAVPPGMVAFGGKELRDEAAKQG